ncbi:MAG: DMT family transporter [Pseudomonadota bacterium]
MNNQIGRAVICALVAAAGFAMMYGCLKALGDGYSPFQLVFFRSLFAFAVLGPILMHVGARFLHSRRPLGHAARAVAGVVSMGCFFYAASRIPLTDLLALVFTMPLFVTVFAVVFLRERVGWYRWSAVLVGFVGVLLVVNPAGGAPTEVYAVALLGGASYALAAIALRSLGRTEPASTTFFYFTATSVVLSGSALPWVWVTAEPHHWWWFIGSGLLGGIAQYYLVEAYRHGEASLVAPFEYSQMLWVIVIGWYFWRESPTTHALMGGALVIGAGLFIVHRESVRARGAAAEGR